MYRECNSYRLCFTCYYNYESVILFHPWDNLHAFLRKDENNLFKKWRFIESITLNFSITFSKNVFVMKSASVNTCVTKWSLFSKKCRKNLPLKS